MILDPRGRRVIRRLERSLTEQAAAVAGVLGNPALRRLELAWGGFYVVEWTSLVALSVWAYREGGASGVGLVGLLRMLPAALALPFGALVTDRFPRQRVLASVYGLQAILLAMVALVIQTGGPVAVAYGIIVLIGVGAAPCRPAHLSLVPVLARSPGELVAANVTASTFEGLATLTGPLLAGVLLAVGGTPITLAVAAAVSASSALLAAGIGTKTDPTRAARRSREPVLTTLTGGFRELVRLPELVVITGAICAQTMVRGMLNVYLVALAIVTLGLGEGGVGVLNAAFGVGGIAGALVSTAFVGGRRLSRPLATGLSLWGLPLIAMAVWPSTGVALAALAVVGIGNAVLDVSGFTLLQRLADDRALGGFFGLVVVGILAGVGVGSILAPVAIDLVGLRAAIALSGALLPALAVILFRRLSQADERAAVPEAALNVIASVPLFAPLPPTCLEKLARASSYQTVTAETQVIREGDEGHTFNIVVDGSLEATCEGRHLRTLGTGDCFGEVALLRDIPRTASIRAKTGATLLVLRRPDFLSAVLGTREIAAAVEAIIDRHAETTSTENQVALHAGGA